MRKWLPGDPIGGGAMIITDRVAYAKQCTEAIVTSAARDAFRIGGLDQRRAFIATYPEGQREHLKAAMTQLWQERQNKREGTT